MVQRFGMACISTVIRRSQVLLIAQVVRAPVLVLNLNYVPVNVCTVRRAVVLLWKAKAEMLENHRGQLRTVDRTIDAPSVIRLVY